MCAGICAYTPGAAHEDEGRRQRFFLLTLPFIRLREYLLERGMNVCILFEHTEYLLKNAQELVIIISGTEDRRLTLHFTPC